ncbi:phage portal protein [Bifidobacterium sp. M0353]|uniref:phage portal protein n=1 Tax=Bifidobacterium sp. M0353 TaxID=2751006 RepID=UPI0018DBA663|nr:phage portal protein [Bifidobacterium sp. M0353]MBI0150335.1 phage portal protein [Bifidobacterium sp. M0353]
MIMLPQTIRGLTAAEQDLYRRLLRRLLEKRGRNRLRSKYYDGRNELKDIGYSLPPVAKDIEIVVGWPEKAVEALANRVVLDGVTMQDGSDLSRKVADLLDENDLRNTATSAHADALVHSCSFIAVLRGDTSIGEPEAIIQEFSADNATGIWDKRRHGLSSALLFEVTDDGKTVQSIYLMDYEHTVVIVPAGPGYQVYDCTPNTGRIPCELLAYKPDAKRPFGRSRISRTVMSLTDSAVRTFLRSEMQAELYSVPPRYFLGVEPELFRDENDNEIPTWKLMMDHILAIPKDKDGEKPEVGQFPQYSFEPHSAQLRQTASMFAAATSMPPDMMGVLTDNPSSAEAIDKAQKELCLAAEQCQSWFGPAWERIIDRAQKLAGPDGSVQAVACQWRNPSTPSRAAAADAAVKLVQAGILPADSDVTYDMLDLSDRQRRTLRKEQRAARAQGNIDQLRARMNMEAAGGSEQPETDRRNPDGTAETAGAGAQGV